MSKTLIFLFVSALVFRGFLRTSGDPNSRVETEDNSENKLQTSNLESVFSDVYSKCFLALSYTCIQRRTLLYLKGLNEMQEIPLLGDFIKLASPGAFEKLSESSSLHLTELIDDQVEVFFKNHALQMGREKLALSNEREEARKKKKGGGGGDGGHGDGKKKMMMMAVMCMKMKMMMVMPAMLGMMGMMSFKGMMFGMMSFMIAKMMLLMKLLQSKGGAGGGDPWTGGGGGGSGAGGWAAGGGQADNYGGSGGGYNAAGEWQSRNIAALGEASNQSTQNRKKRASTLGPNILHQLRRYSDLPPVLQTSSIHHLSPTTKISTIWRSEEASPGNVDLNDTPAKVEIIEWTPNQLKQAYANDLQVNQNATKAEETAKTAKAVLEYEDIYKNNNIPEQLKYNPEVHKRNCTLSKILLKEFLDQLNSKSQFNMMRTPRTNSSPKYGHSNQMTDLILNSTKESYKIDGDNQYQNVLEDKHKIQSKSDLTIEDNKHYPQIRFKRHLSYLWQDEADTEKKKKKLPKKKSKFQKIMETVEDNPWI